MSLPTNRVAIFGAGLSGLSCARRLVAAGMDVAVFEKSRGFGGRCATRRWEGHVVDHGAQYFTMRDPEFSAEIRSLGGDGLREITAAIVNEDGVALPAFSPRWYHVAGNNTLGRALADGLDVRRERPVSEVRREGGRWEVAGESFDAVVSSAPAPQTDALLGREPRDNPFSHCLTALFAYDGEPQGLALDAYARSTRSGALSWSACENHKAGRIAPGQTVFVAQASPEFSRREFDADPAAWSAILRDELESAWNLDPARQRAACTHRWRFARRLEPVDSSDLPERFFLTGDNLTESRVESAWLAGRETAQRVRLALGA